jgi:hypothetical protein
MIHISKSNNKLGNIYNISLPPIITCMKNIPCTELCYAKQSYNRWKNVKKAWNDNWNFYLESGWNYFDQIQKYITANKVKYFRWHVGGDIPDSVYYTGMVCVAINNKDTKFLTFTKRVFPIIYRRVIPDNFKVIQSCWPNMPVSRGKLTKAWMQDGTETRIPKNARICNKKCDECFDCWNETTDVVFNYHKG